MPELPEVETARRGIEPHVQGQVIGNVIVRNRKLRWPVPNTLPILLRGSRVESVYRRGKYLILNLTSAVTESAASLIIHLGMSGSLKIVQANQPAAKHDHVDIAFSNQKILRYTDPRRFGCVLWHEGDSESHKLLCKLGPEPLSEQFSGDLLFDRSRRRIAPIKSFIMDASIVVGVGNIYANEALFAAGIAPTRKAGTLSRKRYQLLVLEIKAVLKKAIALGGTTLKDFVGGDGKPGYFKQELSVYGRAGLPCVRCNKALIECRLAQRSTVYCCRCQH